MTGKHISGSRNHGGHVSYCADCPQPSWKARQARRYTSRCTLGALSAIWHCYLSLSWQAAVPWHAMCTWITAHPQPHSSHTYIPRCAARVLNNTQACTHLATLHRRVAKHLPIVRRPVVGPSRGRGRQWVHLGSPRLAACHGGVRVDAAAVRRLAPAATHDGQRRLHLALHNDVQLYMWCSRFHKGRVGYWLHHAAGVRE